MKPATLQTIYQGGAMRKRRSVLYMAWVSMLIILGALMLYAIAENYVRESEPKMKPSHEWQLFGFK